jgi:tellurite resistance protein TerC
MKTGIAFWIGFFVFVILMLMLDLFVFHKKNKVVKVKDALLSSLFWIFLAFLFNVGIFFVVRHTAGFELGKQKAVEFLTGYLIEESLSVDNLFVFIMIFGFFKIDPKYQHKVLFWGIIGAIIMRAVFIFAGVAIISRFDWVMYIFGAFLIYTGVKMVFEKGDTEYNPNNNGLIRGFKKIFPVTDDMSHPGFFIRRKKVLYATPFFIALLVIEVSDLIFAVDSIPAVLSVSKDPFIVYTSNIFAVLGLRSLYFALNGIMDFFHYLKYALSGILTFIGLKMCINELSSELDYSFHISNFASLGVIVSFLTASILLSIVVKNRKERTEKKMQA